MSSAASMASDMLRFFGEWNCRQSRSSTKRRTSSRRSTMVVVASEGMGLFVHVPQVNSKGAVFHQVEATGKAAAVCFSAKRGQSCEHPVILIGRDGTRQRMAQPHDEFGSLQVGELGRIVLHRLKQAGHGC